jgi:DNA-binding cell septation regulator SpoVG
VPGNVAAGRPCEAVNPTHGPPEASTKSTALVQVRINKSGVVHDVRVVSGERQTFLAVTLMKGAAPNVEEARPTGVSSCIPLPARVRVLQIVMQWYLIRCVST